MSENLPAKSEFDLNENGYSESAGYTYILVRKDNSSLVKIGFTSVSAQSRAQNYTDGDWRIHKTYAMPVWLAKIVERASHKNLRNYWLDPKITGGTASEIFTCSVDIAENAVELAFIEELESVLTSLKLPPKLIEYTLSKNGVQISTDLDALLVKFDEKQKQLLLKISESEQEWQQKEKILIDKIQSLSNEIDIKNNELKYLKDDFNKLSKQISDAEYVNDDDLYAKEIELKTFADKKINLSQFEKLRENFREATHLIEIYRLRENSRK